ncbi:Hsp33 family molecular chaperone HslO [Parachitinimonas caeni]|uniref:Hsp33 family molecular chaperone HslO n=1 Tax=Parachitinimonas caeni TaxID=3031301 RepID=A0ABT7E012_9NEIS|nr:Hsp33 family molecular chaperone HslO [Parachitinimonas caeni]MDK2124688.1 Hsp33 family molecular chaperone HslO [Parachitinimonas caeni]
MSQDTLQRFLFEGAPVRGEIVQLSDSWREIVSRRAFPAPLHQLVGELTAAATLLSATLKFEGSLVMQFHGTSLIKLIAIECESDLTVRATAQWEHDADWSAAAGVTLPALLGRGRCVLTLDPKDGGQTYQGVVGLDGNSVAEIIEHYMQRSEQLDTRIWLACEGERAAGLLIQKLPAGHGDPDAWNRIGHLASTITSNELLQLPSLEVLHRLFHEETVRLLGETHPHFGCRCSRERVGNMLKLVGQEEADAILAEQAQVEVRCEFCNQAYAFDAVDVAQLFAADSVISATSTRH